MFSRHTTTVLTAAMMITVMAACRKERQITDALYSCDAFTVCPDSIDSDMLIVVPRDSVMVTVMKGRTTSRPFAGPVEGRLSMSGSDSLLVDIFNSSVRQAVGRSPVGASPLDIYMTYSLTDPAGAAKAIEETARHSATASSADGFMTPPVIAGDASWGLAARECCLTTGDRNFLDRMSRLARGMIDKERRLTFDDSLFLFKGASAADLAEGMMPPWMTAADFAATISLRANIDRLALYRLAATGDQTAAYTSAGDSLRNSVDTYFWIPNLGCYSRALYGSPFPLQLEATDNISQALAVVGGSASEPMAQSLMASTPLYRDIFPSSYPSPFAENVESDQEAAALWTVAASRTANEKAFNYALSQLVYHSYNRGEASEAVAGAILRGLAGVSPEEDGLHFRPMVPATMPGEKRFTDLRWRDAILDITLNGSGNVISTFSIDGEVSERAVVPLDLTGRHSISVTLVGFSDTRSEVNLVDRAVICPAPAVDWTSARTAVIDKGAAAMTMIYLDGAFIDTDGGPSYRIYADAPVTAATLVSVSQDNRPGFASPTYLYIPATDSISIDIASVAPTGTRSLKSRRRRTDDTSLSRKFVESTRFKNASIPFEVTVGDDCERYISIVYLNGLGIVNPDRRYATRLLTVDGDTAGLFILPQLGPDAWRPDMDWRTLYGTSLPMKVRLKKGTNRLSIDYFAPEAPDFDHDANALIPVKVVIIKP